MKLAIISDIHGNSFALDRVLNAIDDEGISKIVCLGDLALLGFDVVPDGQVCFEAQPGSSHYALAFTLENDFKPLPNLLEFKAGGVRLEYDGALSLVRSASAA